MHRFPNAQNTQFQGFSEIKKSVIETALKADVFLFQLNWLKLYLKI